MRSDWLAILIGMVVLQMMFLWEIDISVSALLISTTLDIPTIATNGWMIISPMLAYHIGLAGVIVNSFFMACISVHLLLKKVDKIE